jgi:hypothetical protein
MTPRSPWWAKAKPCLGNRASLKESAFRALRERGQQRLVTQRQASEGEASSVLELDSAVEEPPRNGWLELASRTPFIQRSGNYEIG